MKSFALIFIAIMILSATIATASLLPVKAQVTTVPAGVTIGPPQLPYTGGPVQPESLQAFQSQLNLT